MKMCDICGAGPAYTSNGICNGCYQRMVSHHNQPMVEVPTVHDRIVQENTGAICDLTVAMTRLIEALGHNEQWQFEPPVGAPERKAWQQGKNQAMRDVVEAAGPGKDQGPSVMDPETRLIRDFVANWISTTASNDHRIACTKDLIRQILGVRGELGVKKGPVTDKEAENAIANHPQWTYRQMLEDFARGRGLL